jgi:transcription elongation factor Elf1
MDQLKIVCVYCKKNAELMTSNNTTTVICSHCGTAIEFETYKELFDNWVYKMTNKLDER